MFDLLAEEVSEHVIRQSGKPGRVKRLRDRKYFDEPNIAKLQILALSLTQTCKQIREEFRPIHFKQHAVALYDLSAYLYGHGELMEPLPFRFWRQTVHICSEVMTTL